MSKPVIAITAGDPLGIGPEVLLKTIIQMKTDSSFTWIIICDQHVLIETMKQLSLPGDMFVNWDIMCSSNITEKPTNNLILSPVVFTTSPLPYGTVDKLAGHAALTYIKWAAILAKKGLIDGIVTGPINKQAIRLAGTPHIGHTEILADHFSVVNPLTMFQTKQLRVFFLTRHLSLKRACETITADLVLEGIRTACSELTRLDPGILRSAPLAVAALNPHGGDGGLIGLEEIQHITPAVQQAIAEGLNVVGPIPADSVFYQGSVGKYCAVLSLYHDQGHIACKTLDFHGTVSLTLGLPTLRTSVDHGTGFDIAGMNKASPQSMIMAIKTCLQYIK